MENETVCRHEIFALINDYTARKKFFHEEMNNHGIHTIDGFGNFCNRERCSDFIMSLKRLVNAK